MSTRLRGLDDTTLHRRLALLDREAAFRPLTSVERRERDNILAVLARRQAQREGKA